MVIAPVTIIMCAVASLVNPILSLLYTKSPVCVCSHCCAAGVPTVLQPSSVRYRLLKYTISILHTILLASVLFFLPCNPLVAHFSIIGSCSVPTRSLFHTYKVLVPYPQGPCSVPTRIKVPVLYPQNVDPCSNHQRRALSLPQPFSMCAGGREGGGDVCVSLMSVFLFFPSSRHLFHF